MCKQYKGSYYCIDILRLCLVFFPRSKSALTSPSSPPPNPFRFARIACSSSFFDTVRISYAFLKHLFKVINSLLSGNYSCVTVQAPFYPFQAPSEAFLLAYLFPLFLDATDLTCHSTFKMPLKRHLCTPNSNPKSTPSKIAKFP